MNTDLRNIFLRNQYSFHPVVKFDPGKDRLLAMDLTEDVSNIIGDLIEDTDDFSKFIAGLLSNHHCRYGVGGYAEYRSVYSRSKVFDAEKPGEEPRRLHLGTDIWGSAGTPVYAPIGGMVHSFAFNDHHGDYGATIILLHQLEGFPFYTLYGHLSLRDIAHIREGHYVIRGQELAHFGEPHENGHWPPHLHMQVILDLGVFKGDYPGVCKYSEKEKYLNNSPDPDLIIQLNRFIKGKVN